MLKKDFLLFIYRSAYMQRWNDHLRPIDLYELDKQAHKMIIAYTLAKIEENNGADIDWSQIIEKGIFEFLQRIALTDMKPSLFYKIKQDKEKYIELNNFILEKISSYISEIDGGQFLLRFKGYIYDDVTNLQKFDINKKILKAAHFLSTKWEFQIISTYNHRGSQIQEISSDLIKREQSFKQLFSMKELAFSINLRNFLNLCAELRYQIRWNHLYRVPKTSVLGHMLIVAIISYFFSLEIGADNGRIFNNFFTGLFHDLPEVLTRDIISPVKTSVTGLDEFIKKFEQEEMGNIYDNIPIFLANDLKQFTGDEFFNKIINKSQRDGDLVKVADKLAALIEAYLSLNNGISSNEMRQAVKDIVSTYQNKIISGINLSEIFCCFYST
ncbi:MAG: HD domain-containing protein [bacterium]|nr:HD domain-containing protein [bacterium]